MVETEILQILEQMSEPLKLEVLHYAKYLAANYIEVVSEQPLSPTEKQETLEVLPFSDGNERPIVRAESEEEAERKYGYGSLAGQIVMSDDFDEPLEDLKTYMWHEVAVRYSRVALVFAGRYSFERSRQRDCRGEIGLTLQHSHSDLPSRKSLAGSR